MPFNFFEREKVRPPLKKLKAKKKKKNVKKHIYVNVNIIIDKNKSE